MLTKILIPEMLLICIKNERECELKKIIVQKHRKIPAISEAMRKFWAKMPKAKKEKRNRKQSKSMKKVHALLTPEERKANTRKANETLRALHKDPVEKLRLLKINQAQVAKINDARVQEFEDLPRVNDYSGIITASEMEKLYA